MADSATSITYHHLWQDILIIITYTPDCSSSFKALYGSALAHIEINAEEPLPITKTGYRSIFLQYSHLKEGRGVVELIDAELEAAANSPEWMAYQPLRKQLDLF